MYKAHMVTNKIIKYMTNSGRKIRVEECELGRTITKFWA